MNHKPNRKKSQSAAVLSEVRPLAPTVGQLNPPLDCNSNTPSAHADDQSKPRNELGPFAPFHDLEAIFHAAINGYGLATLPVSEVYQSLQAISRHRPVSAAVLENGLSHESIPAK